MLRLLLFFCVVATPIMADKITSGDYSVQVLANDLVAYHGSSQVLSMRALFQKEFDAFKAEQDKETLPCSFENTVHVMSLMGPYLSLRDEFFSMCARAAHPSEEKQVATYDLRKLPAPAAITDLFPEGVVLRALLKDSVLAPQLQTKPASLAALQAALPQEGFRAGKTECPFLLTDDFTKRFALHHVEGANIAVRISLEPAGGACRSATADLGLLLPLPDGLKGLPFVAGTKAAQVTIRFEAK